MNSSDLDVLYTRLANSVQEAGDQGELFLAMLCLKLAAACSTPEHFLRAMEEVRSALIDAESQPRPDIAPPQTE